MQKLRNAQVWEDVESQWNKIKDAMVTAGVAINALAKLYGMLFDAKDEYFIVNMQNLLGKKIVVKKDIAILIYTKGRGYDIPGFSQRNVLVNVDSEFKHSEFSPIANDYQQELKVALTASLSDQRKAIFRSMDMDELERWKQDIIFVWRESKGKIVTGPTNGESIQILKDLGKLPENCECSNAGIKYYDFVRATHPEHGLIWCHSEAQFPMSAYDGRWEIAELDKREMIEILVMRSDHVRHQTKTVHGLSQKWGTIIRDKALLAMLDTGIEIPRSFKSVYDERKIQEVVHKYLNPAPFAG